MKRWIVILMLGIYLCGCEKKSEPINDEVSEEHQRLLIMDEVNREDYESNRFYAMGDPVVFLSGDQNDVLWQVTLTDYEVIQDSHEGFKKALVLHFNYRYFMPEFIMSQTLQSVVHLTVFYQDIALKPQSLAEATIAYNIGNYAKSPHILYEPIVNDEMICKLVYLQANTDQSCFNYYSYAGPGEYLISFESGKGEHFNYMINVKE